MQKNTDIEDQDETILPAQKTMLDRILKALTNCSIVQDCSDHETSEYLQPSMTEGLDQIAIGFASQSQISFRDLSNATITPEGRFKLGEITYALITETEINLHSIPESQEENLEMLKASLTRYTSERVPTGSFLRAVLENNLHVALRKADDVSRSNLLAISSYVYNELPGNIWGNPEKVEAHLKNTRSA